METETYMISNSLKPFFDSEFPTGKIALAKQNLEDALSYFLKAYEVDPSHEQIKRELATIYFYQAEKFFARKDFLKAKEALLKSVEFDPMHPLTHLNLGALYFQEGNISAAAREWAVTKELDPQNVEAEKNLKLLEKAL